MGGKNYIPIHGVNLIQILSFEKKLLEKNFSFLKSSIHNGVLICHGFCQPTQYSTIYKYKVRFVPNQSPKVYVIEPKIIYDDDIHIYKEDNSLCLYYPKDLSYSKHSHLYDTIIPWIHEWFLFYELFEVTGKWLHPFVEHKKI